MSPIDPDLDRLISRFLDGEISPEQRRALNRRTRNDPAAAAELESAAALDREVGAAMRRAMGRPAAVRRAAPHWSSGLFRAGVLAAAACVGAFAWFGPAGHPASGPQQPAMAGSWFVTPSEQQVDVVEPDATPYARPNVRLRDTNREVIVLPSRHAGQLLLIEVDRVRTRPVRIHKDY